MLGLSACQSVPGDLRALVSRAGVALTAAAFRQLVISQPDAIVRRDRAAANVAIVTGLIFIVAGLVEFVFHGWELHAFRGFGLPSPGAFEILAGVLETVGGAFLALRVLIAPVALILALTMVVAIGASGIADGDVIPSLTLAPAVFLAIVFLLVRAFQHDRIRRPSPAGRT